MTLFKEVYARSRFSELNQEELYSPEFQHSVRRLPVNLFIIRHGYSWGNWATEYLREKKLDQMPPEVLDFVTTHPGWMYPLTTAVVGDMPAGTEQAFSVSGWFQDAFPFPLHRAYFSTHTRAAQSMYLGTQGLNVPRSRVYRDTQQAERNWGIFDMFNIAPEVVAQYHEFRDRRDLDPLNASPPYGENMVSVIFRTTGKMLPRLYRKCSDQNVALFCHGEVAWGYRYQIEGMTPEDYLVMHRSKSKMADVHIHNSQIIWYTRLDPFTGEEHRTFRWVKFVVPWEAKHNVDWKPISPSDRIEAAFERLAQTTQIPERQLYVTGSGV